MFAGKLILLHPEAQTANWQLELASKADIWPQRLHQGSEASRSGELMIQE
jgi:hypothetical protein